MARTLRDACTLLFALLALAVSACATLQDPMQYEQQFREQQRSFSQYVRWGNFHGASAFVVEDQMDEFLALAPELTDVRFTDYEILRFELKEDRTRATIDVIYTGYRLSSPISRVMRLHQEWTKTDGEWRVRLEMGPVREALGLAAK